ncbi:hypothetical protein C1645_681601, partial [Glomus cerebriforme]
IGLMIFFDIILPFILYYILKNHIKELWALVISGIPPFIIAIYGLISKRRVEILGVVIIISFIVSALVTLLRNDPRIQLLRKSSITGSLGLIFIITLIPIKIRTFEMRPASFYLFKDMAMGGTFGLSSSSINLPGLTEDEPISERWDRYWNSYPSFRRTFIVLTAVWGCGFLSEVPIRTVIV